MPHSVGIEYTNDGEDIEVEATYGTPEGMDPEAWRAQLKQILEQIAAGYADGDGQEKLFDMEITDDGDVRVIAKGHDDDDRRETTMATATGMVIDLLLDMDEEYALAFGQYLQMRASGMNQQPPSQKPQQQATQPPGQPDSASDNGPGAE